MPSTLSSESSPATSRGRRPGPFFTAAIVWFVWVACTVVAVALVWRQSPLLPYADDWEIVPIVTGAKPLDWSWLWAQHNEHRIVIPKLFFVAMARAGGADYRWLILGNVAVLSSLAGLFLKVARKIRGDWSITDLFLPLLFLNFTQGALWWGFEFQFVSSTALTSVILASLLWQGPRITSGGGLLIGGCLAALPLCGGNGLLCVPVLGSWVAWRGLAQLRGRNEDATSPSGRPVRRVDFGGIALVLGAVAAITLSAAYFVGYISTEHPWSKAGPWLTLQTTVHVLASGFGLWGGRVWPIPGLAVAVLIGGTLAWTLWLLSQAADRGKSFYQKGDLVAGMTAILMVCLAIGYGRGGQSWSPASSAHYSTLALPAIAAAYLALIVTAPRLLRLAVHAALTLTMLCFQWRYAPIVSQFTAERDAKTKLARADLIAGISETQVAEKHAELLFPAAGTYGNEAIARGIKDLRQARFPNFGEAR